MTTLVKAFLAMMFVCLVAVQSVSAQDNGRYSDPDVPGKTDGTVPYSDDAILLDIMLMMMDYDVDADEALVMLLLVMSDPDHHDEAIAIPNLLKSDGGDERNQAIAIPNLLKSGG